MSHAMSCIACDFDSEKYPQQTDSGIEVEKEPEVVCPQVTTEDLQSVESLLSLAPSLVVNKGKNACRGRKNSKPTQAAKQKAGTKVVPKGVNELLYKTIEAVRLRNEKRYVDLGEAFCSPLCNKVVNMHGALLNQELSDVFYQPKTGVFTVKGIFESFFRGQYVASNGIDVFVDVLNLEEKKKDRKSSPYRLFLFSTMMPDIMYKETYTENQRLNIFSSNFEDILLKYEVKKLESFDFVFSPVLLKYEVKKLESVDFVFSPVLQGDHFYVLCFHLKTGKIELIDNSAAKQYFEEKYKGLPETLRKLLVLYLQKALNPTPAIKALETSMIERKEMKWRTLTNGIDCGVFTMRLMETYKGENTMVDWVCERR
ncbi:putative Ulp1 protease family catalytic domain, papain-like cysteine peptidase superfamily [Helianthus anomalus]